MKLVRYGAKGAEKPGLIDKSGQLRDLSAHVRDLDGEAYAPASLAKLAALDTSKLPAVDGKQRFGAPVTGISKFVAIGLNYADHAKETGSPIPTEPIFFHQGQHLAERPERRGRKAARLDQARLGSRNRRHHRHPRQICQRGRRAQPRRRLLRLQRRLRAQFPDERGGQWTKGKSHDTFGPVGPWLVTKDEIPDVQKLSMWLDVNGQRRQTGSTSTMIFSMAKCISYVSQFMTLLPGDIVTTGTPPGVGAGMKPPQFLNVGDVVTLGIEGLGEQRQEIIAA